MSEMTPEIACGEVVKPCCRSIPGRSLRALTAGDRQFGISAFIPLSFTCAVCLSGNCKLATGGTVTGTAFSRVAQLWQRRRGDIK
jgi:hypothetical protein